MRRSAWPRAASLLLLALLAACGDQDDAQTPASALDAVLDALRSGDGGRVLAWVDVPAAEATDPKAISGIEETLRQLGGVEFRARTRSGALVAPDAPSRLTVEIRRRDGVGSARELGIALVARNDGFKVTVASMQDLLRSALDVATGQSAQARQTAVALSFVSQAIDLFRVDNDRLPDDLRLLVNSGQGGAAYLSALPRDGWGRAYHYEIRDDGTYDLRSAGADGQVGTTDDVLPPAR